MFNTLTLITLLAYLAAAFLFIFELLLRKEALGVWGLRVIVGNIPLHLATVVVAVAMFGMGGLFSLPNALTLLAVFLAIFYVVLQKSYGIRELGSLIAPLAVILLTVVLLMGTDQVAPMPGVLLPVHVALALTGTVAFALAFSGALLYTVQERQLRTKKLGSLFRFLPDLESLDRVSFRSITVGFPVYTAAILLGVVWLSQSEPTTNPTWSIVFAVISWVLYGLVLHARLTAGWRGRRAAMVTIVGFLSTSLVFVAYLVQ